MRTSNLAQAALNFKNVITNGISVTIKNVPLSGVRNSETCVEAYFRAAESSLFREGVGDGNKWEYF
jgi:hypothetical protein